MEVRRRSTNAEKVRRSQTAAIVQLSVSAGARRFGAAVALGEFLNPARGIDKFLLASEKRMTSGTNPDSNVATRRPGVINRATRADHVGFKIFRMNVGFHLWKRSANLPAMDIFRKG